MDMKNRNIYKVFGILLSLVLFTACEDEAKSPVINAAAQDGTLSFVLNESQYSNWTYVLSDANASKEMDALTCKQPDYGFTAAVTYTTQVSFTNTFAAGTFQSLPTSIKGEKVSVNTKEMNKAMIALSGGVLPDPVVTKDVYVRLKAMVSEATKNPLSDTLTVKPLYSNVIKIKVQPYIEPLMPFNEVTPMPYYIVGLGDGTWNNSTAGLGKSLIPLSVVAGNKYNAQGAGEYTFTGYFQASRTFKLIRDIGSWTEQWGNKGGDGINNLINKAIAGEEPSNIKVPTDGYYTITLNSINNTLKVVASTATIPANLASMGMIGEFNGWAADVAMSPVETKNNHVWYVTYTFSANSASDGGCKFRANGNWDVNWGAPNFPIGIGTPGGKNILFKSGKYTAIFNDIDGCYYFIQ